MVLDGEQVPCTRQSERGGYLNGDTSRYFDRGVLESLHTTCISVDILVRPIARRILCFVELSIALWL